MPSRKSRLTLHRNITAFLHTLCKLQDVALFIMRATSGQSSMRVLTCALGKEGLRWCAGRGLLGTSSHLGAQQRRPEAPAALQWAAAWR